MGNGASSSGRILPDSYKDSYSLKRESSSLSVSNSSSSSSPGFGLNERTPSYKLFSTSSKSSGAQELISPRIWYGERRCHEDRRLRTAFLKYLISQEWKTKLQADFARLFSRRLQINEATEDVIFGGFSLGKRNSASFDASSMDYEESERMSSKFTICTQLKIKETSAAELIRKRNSSLFLFFNMDQLQDMILTTIWPLFMESAFFANEIGSVSSPVLPFDDNEDEEDAKTDGESSTNGVFENLSRRDQERIDRLTTFYANMIQCIPVEALEQKLKTGKWAKSSLSCIDDCSLPIAISSAKPADRPTFPIVYTNRSFEGLTQFSREEMIGNDFRSFFYYEKTEIDQVQSIAQALAEGTSSNIAVTSVRKDGSSYFNFLSLRTVYDREEENYKYIVNLPYDISSSDASLHELKMAEDFLSMICNILRG